MKERGEMEQVLEGVIAHRSFWLNRRNLSTRVGIGWAVESSGLKTSEAGGGGAREGEVEGERIIPILYHHCALYVPHRALTVLLCFCLFTFELLTKIQKSIETST